eukprot:jgi/Bigna1/91009/estExt_fgenesh1_pg.C_850084
MKSDSIQITSVPKKKKDKKKKKSGKKKERRKSAFIEQTIKQIGEYRVRKRIGKGGFGSVYMVTSSNTGKTHAIKRISLKGTPQSELESIEMEIKLLKYLQHPNIVTYIDVIPEPKEGYLNIVLELCEQGSLASILKDFGKFEEPLTCKYVSQVLKGLDFLHQQGVIHRDIKGANILADKEGNVKLADFGVATKIKNSSDPDNQLPAGTTYWMAPEIVKMTGQLSYACDIWSLGSTIIELLTGQPPYFELPMMSACFRIVQDDHPPLPQCSENCKAFLMSCFQKDPQRRLQASVLMKHEWLKGQDDVKQIDNSFEQVGRRVSDGKTQKLNPQGPTTEAKVNSFKSQRSTDDSEHTYDSKKNSFNGIEKKARTWQQNNWMDDTNTNAANEDDGAPAFPDMSFPDVDELDAGGIGIDQAADDNFDMMVGEKNLEQYQENEDDDFDDFGDVELDLNSAGGSDFEEMDTGDQVMELNFEEDDAPKEMDKNSALLRSLQDAFENLNLDNHEETIMASLRKLSTLVTENRGKIGGLVNDLTLGMISIVDMLTSKNDNIIYAVIKFVNDLLHDEGAAQNQRGTKFQQSICTIGIISLIVKYSSPRYPIRIRSHACNFVRHLCYSNEYTRKMFIACGGLPVLIRFLYEDYTNDSSRQLILSSIDCIKNIFEIKSNPKNDFCRLFCKFGLLPRLAKVFFILSQDTKHDDVKGYLDRIVRIFSLFSGGDKLVREKIAEVSVVKYILPVLPKLEFDNLFIFMKTFHRVCGVKSPTPRKLMEDAGIIPVFVQLLDHPRKEIHNQAILCMEMLMDISKSRKEKAIYAGIIPYLLEVIDKKMLLKQVALRILCDLPISVPAVRVELRKHRMVEFYVQTLSDTCWRTDALNALKLWLQAEPSRIGYQLTTSVNIPKIIQVCTSSKVYEKHVALILPTLNSMMRKSEILNRALAASPRFVLGLIGRLDQKIQDDPTMVAIIQSSVEIMNIMCDKNKNLVKFNKKYNAFKAVQTIAESAKAAGKKRLCALAENCLTSINKKLQSQGFS